MNKDAPTPDPAESPEALPITPETGGQHNSPQRLAALDAFRGLTILGMLLVNNIALDTETPAPLTHAPWNGGLRFADLVFPWFLLIVGVAIPFSAASARKKGLSGRQYARRALGRVITLLFLGCLIDSSIARQPLFDLDVLQLIGLAYGMASLLSLLPLRPRLAAAALLLIGHWAVIRFIHVPGMATGTFTENQNVISYVNQRYLQRVHLAGLVSVVPATALTLIGTAMGDVLRHAVLAPPQKMARLLFGGLVLIALGWAWNFDLPFNKPVWTASYILFAAGWGALLLGLLYGVMDIRNIRGWAFPFLVFGANAITAYVAPILVKLFILQVWVWPHGAHLTLQQTLLNACIAHAGRIGGGWLYTGFYILACWLMLFLLYRKGIFVRA